MNLKRFLPFPNLSGLMLSPLLCISSAALCLLLKTEVLQSFIVSESAYFAVRLLF